MGEEEDMEEVEAVTEEVDTLGEEEVVEEEGEEEVDMVEEEVVDMVEEEVVVREEEEGVVIVGEEVLAEEVVTSKGHKASPHQALDSHQVQRCMGLSILFVCPIHHLSLHSTPSSLATPSPLSHPHTLSPHHTLSPTTHLFPHRHKEGGTSH